MKKILDKLPRSSKGDGSVSRTVKGILTAFIPVILVVAQAYDYDIDRLVLVDIVTAITAVVATVMTLYGLGAKVVNRNRTEKV